jgi:hypothetical protein
MIGALHAAEKAPAVRAEYERAFANIHDSERAAGRDVTSPAALEAIGQRAYEQSKRAKFLQDNALVEIVNNAINRAKAPTQSPAMRALGYAADVLLPIRRTPTNIIADALEHLGGLPVGAIRAGTALYRGIDNLPPRQADSIMRMMKRGTLGLPLLALGYYLGPQLVGGLYTGRRRQDETQVGEMRLGNVTIPAWATAHHPAFMALHVGATIRRFEQPTSRHPGEGRAEATAHGMMALIEEVPMVREQVEIGHMLQGRGVGSLARSLAVPQLLQWAAARSDVNPATGNVVTGTPFRRTPHTILQNVEMGLPGLRQQVPRSQR